VIFNYGLFSPFLQTFPLVFFPALCQYVDMVCDYCGGDTKVTNSRWQKRSNRVWRRRECLRCGNLVTTLEAPDYAVSFSFKNLSGVLEPFLRDKLFLAVYHSLQHRKTALDDATALTETIMSGLPACMEDGAVVRDKLVTHVTSVISRFDHAAGVYYRAYYPVSNS